ncbi:unnamed protein product [Alopecurus aequalis]
MATSGQIQPLKIPDAVVALAQAAAKANGETEKYLPGWPLFSPPKMQLTKCAKCPREFCSSVALRRHSRVHRRALKLDKDFPKNRDHLAAFWDKDIKGSSILTALSSWMCKPGYASLPLAYARAGNELLVEAWSADKAAEALRCQKLLVEEEDAAQKRQTEIMERKRMKKLRQKEQRSKGLKDEDVMVQLPEMADGAMGSPSIESLEAISGSGLSELEDPQSLRLPAPTSSYDNGFSGEDATCDSGHGIDSGVVFREQAMPTANRDRLENIPQSSTVSGSVTPLKHPSSARHPRHRDPNASAVSNRSRTWAWKVRTDVEERGPRAELAVGGGHEAVLADTDKSSWLLIGSISVAVEDGGDKCLQGSQPSKDYPTPESHPVAKVVESISHDGCEDSNGGDATPTAEDCSPSSVVTDESGTSSCCDAEAAAGGGSRGGAVFSGEEAAVFLSRRWKEAIGGDHVKLVLCSDN